MDEADGRPGHVAPQSGHLNALPDVPAVSLSLPFANLLTRSFRKAGANLLNLSTRSLIDHPLPITGEHP